MRNSDQPLTPGIKVRSHVDGLGVGICSRVCSSCLRRANLAFSKCCSAATPLLPFEEALVDEGTDEFFVAVFGTVDDSRVAAVGNVLLLLLLLLLLLFD